MRRRWPTYEVIALDRLCWASREASAQAPASDLFGRALDKSVAGVQKLKIILDGRILGI